MEKKKQVIDVSDLGQYPHLKTKTMLKKEGLMPHPSQKPKARRSW